MSESAVLARAAAAPRTAPGAWLRPRSATEILDGAFALYRSTFARLVPRLLLFGLPVGLLALVSPIFAQALNLLYLTPCWLALALRDGMDELEGRPRSLGAATGSALRAWLPLLVLGLVYTFALVLAGFVAFLPGMVIVSIASAADSARLGAVFAVLFGLCGIGAVAMAWAHLGLYAPVYLLERRGNPFTRSVALVRRGFWKTVGVLLLAALITMLPAGVLQGVIALEDTPVAQTLAEELGGRTWHVLAGVAVTALVTPFSSFALLLLWIDRRAVREGVDLAPRGHALDAS